MQEEQNEFERLLKEKADRFEMKPSPEVWQDVQSAIQQNRRRPFAWWWMAAALFAVLGTGAFFMWQNKSQQHASSSATENNPDGSNSAANNSSSEKTNTEKNPAAISSGTTPLSQSQAADNTPSKNQEEKISKGRNENEKSRIVSSGNSRNDISLRNVISNPDESLKKNEQQEEVLSLLSSKESALPSLKNSIHGIPVLRKESFGQNTSIDFSSASSSNHSFYFEADAMPLESFVRNRSSVSPVRNTLGLNNSPLPPDNSSYSFTKGFSAGGNFILEQDKIWLFGIGLHLTKTHLEAITAQQSFPVYDTSYVFDGNAYQPEIAYTGDTIVYQSQGDVNQWLDVSLMTGVKLFPSSPKESSRTKNHVRILAGVGYSRLLADKNSHTITPETYDAASYTGAGAYDTTGFMTTTPVYSYHKNQFQLFSEISYQRDITSRLSFTAGGQLHYYPMNLLNTTDISQRMMWVGLKGGLMFRL